MQNIKFYIKITLNDISNEILNEEINEEYRRHTVKSILEILNKLGFQNVNPKKVGDEVNIGTPIVKLSDKLLKKYNYKNKQY